jgi:hypothetical protein
MFDFEVWSQGQLTDSRGILTVHALATLDAHGRLLKR